MHLHSPLTPARNEYEKEERRHWNREKILQRKRKCHTQIEIKKERQKEKREIKKYMRIENTKYCLRRNKNQI